MSQYLLPSTPQNVQPGLVYFCTILINLFQKILRAKGCCPEKIDKAKKCFVWLKFIAVGFLLSYYSIFSIVILTAKIFKGFSPFCMLCLQFGITVFVNL